VKGPHQRINKDREEAAAEFEYQKIKDGHAVAHLRLVSTQRLINVFPVSVEYTFVQQAIRHEKDDSRDQPANNKPAKIDLCHKSFSFLFCRYAHGPSIEVLYEDTGHVQR